MDQLRYRIKFWVQIVFLDRSQSDYLSIVRTLFPSTPKIIQMVIIFFVYLYIFSRDQSNLPPYSIRDVLRVIKRALCDVPAKGQRSRPLGPHLR